MLEGSLKDFTLDDLLQMVSLGEKTGELVLFGETPFGRKSGKIYFEKGEVKDAETEESRGEVAIVELLNIKEGTFRFAPSDVSTIKRSVQRSIPDLVLLSTSKLDEWNKVKARVSSVDVVFKLSTEGIPDEIHLSPVDWKVMTELGKGETIRDVALKLNMTVFDIARVTYGLVALKILREVGVKDPDSDKFLRRKSAPKNFILRLIERLRRI